MKIEDRKGSILVAVVQVVFIGAIAAALLGGCGRKAMPKPPSGNNPPPVSDLDYSLHNNTINLSWTIPPPDDKAKSPVAGFWIYRSKQMFFIDDCPNCPVRFERIGELSAQGVGSDQPESASVVFTQEIEPGYRCFYKVRTYDNNGVAGDDSNLIEFTF